MDNRPGECIELPIEWNVFELHFIYPPTCSSIVAQRGMGRSSPNFHIEECVLGTGVRDDSGTLTSMDPPAEPSLDDKDSVRTYLEAFKQRSMDCWSVPEFKLEAEQEDGTTKSYHFLEFAGTRQLAEDIERMRLLMDAPYMHVKGISYGTTGKNVLRGLTFDCLTDLFSSCFSF